MKERVASFVVAAAIAAIVASVAWSSGVFGYREDGRTFNLTGVGALGRWTLEPVNGLNYWWKDFAPATISVRTGDEVVINLRSADVFHRFYMPEFSIGPVDVEAGHTATVRFKATHAGVFQFYCTSMCGNCHFYMRGWIVVTDPGASPIVPPPLACGLCPLPRTVGPAPAVKIGPGASLVQAGAALYEQKGCFTCHAPEGRGGVPNDNSLSRTVPAHNTTAQKLFLRSREDAEAFTALVEETGDLQSVEETDVSAFPVVRTRFMNAKEIIRKGRFTSGVDPRGPLPPLQMPAWQHLLKEREIDALLVYFVSLYDWESEEEPEGPSR